MFGSSCLILFDLCTVVLAAPERLSRLSLCWVYRHVCECIFTSFHYILPQRSSYWILTSTSSLLILSIHLLFNIRRKHHSSNVFKSLPLCWYCQVSHHTALILHTNNFKNPFLFLSEIFVDINKVFLLLKATFACLIMSSTSVALLPSLVLILSKHLNVLPFCSWCPSWKDVFCVFLSCFIAYYILIFNLFIIMLHPSRALSISLSAYFSSFSFSASTTT